MLVHNWMTQEVVTISPEEMVLRAQELMEEREIRRLPVVHEGKLVGIITWGTSSGSSPRPRRPRATYGSWITSTRWRSSPWLRR